MVKCACLCCGDGLGILLAIIKENERGTRALSITSPS